MLLDKRFSSLVDFGRDLRTKISISSSTPNYSRMILIILTKEDEERKMVKAHMEIDWLVA